VRRAEQELEALRQRQLSETEQLWVRYKTGFEQYLHRSAEHEYEDEDVQPGTPTTEADGEPEAADATSDEAAGAERSAASTETAS
jgi:hypothetical protein